MSTIDDLIAGWQRRIGRLRQENGLMESGKMMVWEKKLVDGSVSENEITNESIIRNKEWISELEKLIIFLHDDK